MTGWQRFFLLFLMSVALLICFPQYGDDGKIFLALAFILWTSIIIFFTVIMNLLAIVKVDFLHRLFSLMLLIVMAASLLYYFPLEGDETPYIRLKNKEWPTKEDMQRGAKRLTFSYDFVNKGTKQNHPLKDQMDTVSKIKKRVEDKVQEQIDSFNIVIEEEEEENTEEKE